MPNSILVDTEDSVLWIRLNRPEVFNSFDEEMGLAFVKALEAGADEGIRCVVITGEGKAFCAGEDLRALAGGYQKGAAPDLGDILRRRYIPAVELIHSLEKPVVAAINGVAAGAGVSIALACDHRIMAEEASLVLAFSKAGLIPDAGGTWLLPKYLGVGRALELAFRGDALPAQKALDLGLVNKLVPASEVQTAARAQAEEFAAGPTVALALMKRLIWRAAGGYLSKHLEEEANAQTTAGKTSDHLEGVAAFGEKRAPAFQGR